MKNNIKNLLTFSILILWSLSTFTIAFETKNQVNLANTWIVTAKTGHHDDLAKAIKTHNDYRKSIKDVRNWSIYTPVTGKRLNVFVIRSCCVSWEDMDSYNSWENKTKVMEHWFKVAGPFVDKYEHSISKIDFVNSNWPKDTVYNFVGVRTYKVKMGHDMPMLEGIKMLSEAAKKQKWPYIWTWTKSVNGPSTHNLVLAYKNYADMTPPDISFAEMLSKHLNSKERALKALKQWSSHFDSSVYEIYRYRKNLSM